MSLIGDLLKGKFELPCSEIRLTREAGDPIEIAGPGVIEVNTDGEFEFSIHVSVQDHMLINQFGWKSILPPGSMVPPEQSFQLKADSYIEGVWSGRVMRPQAGGVLGQPVLFGER